MKIQAAVCDWSHALHAESEEEAGDGAGSARGREPGRLSGSGLRALYQKDHSVSLAKY